MMGSKCLDSHAVCCGGVDALGRCRQLEVLAIPNNEPTMVGLFTLVAIVVAHLVITVCPSIRMISIDFPFFNICFIAMFHSSSPSARKLARFPSSDLPLKMPSR